MASLLPPTPTATSTLKHSQMASSMKLTTPNNAYFLQNSNHRLKSNSTKCHAVFGDVAKGLVENSVGMDQFQSIQSGIVQFERVTEGLSDLQRWGVLVFGGLTWIYLTARPGVLVGAIDAYLLAPLQLGLDNLVGRRNLKRSDFVVGEKLGEGSFGVVYSGVLVPKNGNGNNGSVNVVQKRGRGKTTQVEPKSKDKVILKKVLL